MARTEATLTACMVVQQLEDNYFMGWTDEELQAINNADPQAICSVFAKRLMDANMIPYEMHCIIHNKDVREVWDSTLNNYVIEQKPPHFHCVIKFLKTDDGILHSGTVIQIACALGLHAEYVEKPKRGKYAYDNMLSYLIHAKDSDKAQYDATEVYSCGLSNKDTGEPVYTTYAEYYRLRKKEWEDGRAKKTSERARVDIDSLEEKILTGEVCRNQILLTDELYEIYARYKRRCDDAFDTYAQRKIAKTMQAMENGEFKVSVIFVTGKSHSGKSVFTDCLVRSIRKSIKEKTGEDWEVCSCAATNPFDEYMGEEILVMDDLRGMSLTASDWLKLLDPDRINTGSARYKNKKMACRTIIINSEKDVIDFFYFLKGSGGDRSETMDQFIRRIMARAVVYRVPDTDERRVSIGYMKEVDAYNLPSPGTASEELTLHHDFVSAPGDEYMDYKESLDTFTNIVMVNNKLA